MSALNKSLLATAALVVACAPHPTSQSCGRDRVLRSEGIGSLHINAAVDTIKVHCQVTRDQQVDGVEGSRQRVLMVTLDSAELEATVVDGKIWRISISTERFRTSDGLGVGTTVATLRAMPDARVGPGEDGVYVLIDRHCGLSFRLNAVVTGPVQAWNDVNQQSQVDRVLIAGCGADKRH